MSRKTTKSILSRDEISLLKNSDEIRNTDLYGNLYSILLQITEPEAVTLNELIEFVLSSDNIGWLCFTFSSFDFTSYPTV